MKHLVSVISGILLLMVTASSCMRVRFPYADDGYVDLDTDTVKYSMFSEEDWIIYDNASERLLDHHGTRNPSGFAYRHFGFDYFDYYARCASRLNISDDLYIEIKQGLYSQSFGVRQAPIVEEKIDSSYQVSRFPDEIVWATMHSGSGTHEWRMADYRKIRRYATRKFPGWRDKGFSLEEMDLIVKRFRAAERQKFVILDKYCREIVLIEEPDGSLRPVNALRIVSDDTGSRLRYIDFHQNSRFGKRGYVNIERVKYIYI